MSTGMAARSPDLTLPNFSLWHLLKKKVYTKKLHIINNQKENIHQEIAAIPVDMLQHIFANLEHHVWFCMDARR
jgi:hypothetical protein